MIWIAVSIALICAALLFAQRQEHGHQRALKFDAQVVSDLMARVTALETAKLVQFDPVAFEDLKNKVESFRLAQGLRSR